MSEAPEEKETPPPHAGTVDTTPGSKTNTLPLSGQNESSSSSVKIRKSSNIFTSLVKRARRKRTTNKTSPSEEIKSLHISAQNLSCTSTMSLGVHVEEVEISCENYDKKCTPSQDMYWEETRHTTFNEANASFHHSREPDKNQKKKFDSLGAQYCSETFKDDLVQTSQMIMNVSCGQVTENQNATEHNIEENGGENTAISSFIPFEKPTLDVTLADGLQYIQETVSSLHESENNIAILIAKYITNPSVQKELLTALSQHSKLQWDAERRSCSIANDMWMQQLEIGRAQEKILQGTLNSLVQQNRQLNIENENLYRKHEKVVKMLRGFDTRPRYQEHDAQVDSVLRHNEKLQGKLDTVFKRCESLEGELHIFQQQNDNMEQQLRHCNVKMQNMKAIIYKMRTEYELEQTALNFQLETKEQILREAIEAGDVLVEDLDALKRQLKSMPFDINWSKFKARGSCLTDLIHLCRSCINEMSKELLNMHNEIALKDKDISTLNATNTKLQENLNHSSNELEMMSKKIEDNLSQTTSMLLNEQKCRMLEHELKSSEEKIDGLKDQLGIEKSLRAQSIAEFENFKKEVNEKDKMLEQIKLIVVNVTTENCSLKNDVATLSQMLRETGAGDIARGKEEIQLFYDELREVQQENCTMRTELGKAQQQNAILIANQESTDKHLQKQSKELERLTEEMQTLKQRADGEHQTVLYLQSERMKYLEEKGILKSIIQHLKNEMSKIKGLEQNLNNVTKEASKLGMVAEYNKQQGEKLRKEVMERESVIAQLKTSVHQLNELHMQSAKEKLSLCFELTEVCQHKEKLSEVLNTEVQKNVELGQSKEAIVKSVNTQIQKIEEKQKTERTAIRALLKDIKIITEEKEQLSRDNSKLQMEIDHLDNKFVEQGNKCNELTKVIAKREEENAELRKAHDIFEKKQKEIYENWKNDESKYDLNIKQLRKLIEQLRNEKKELQNSNEYLKKNVEKLNKDLNSSRESQKEIGDLLKQTKEQQQETQNNLNEHVELVKNLTKERDKLLEEKIKLIEDNEKLIYESNYLNTIMDGIVNDFEKCITTSEDKERLFKSESDESKKLLRTYAQEIQDLKNAIYLKEKQIEELNEKVKGEQFQQQRYLKLKDEVENLEMEGTKAREGKKDLEKQLADSKDKYDRAVEHVKNVEEEMHIIEEQLKLVLDQKNEDYVFYKQHIAELVRSREEYENQNGNELQSLRQQLQEVHKKMANEQAAYETLSQVHKEVSGKFLKSIKDSVDVKNANLEVAERLKENQEKIIEIENEKEELNRRICKVEDELNLSQHLVVQLNEENNLLQKSYNKALEKCVALEYQVKTIELDQQETNKEDNAKREDGLQQQLENARNELQASSTTIHKLKMEISALQQEITLLQMERSEITMELHEFRKKLETEENLSEQLKKTHKLLLAGVLQLKRDGRVDSSDCIHLLHMASNFSPGDAEGDSSTAGRE